MNKKHFINFFEDFEDLFTVGEELFKQWQEEENKTCEKSCKCGEKKDDKNKEYFHRVEKDYVNGKCVRSCEKEIVDGQVTVDKNVSYNKDAEAITDNTDKLQYLESYIKDIEAGITDLQKENYDLKLQLENVLKENTKLKEEKSNITNFLKGFLEKA